MIVQVILFVVALVFWFIAQYEDARTSEIGFAKGYVEGNGLANKFFGPRPSVGKLILFNFSQLAVFLGVTFFTGLPGWIGATLALGGKHLLGVRMWKRAFATNGASLREGRSAIQKLLGL